MATVVPGWQKTVVEFGHLIVKVDDGVIGTQTLYLNLKVKV